MVDDAMSSKAMVPIRELYDILQGMTGVRKIRLAGPISSSDSQAHEVVAWKCQYYLSPRAAQRGILEYIKSLACKRESSLSSVLFKVTS